MDVSQRVIFRFITCCKDWEKAASDEDKLQVPVGVGDLREENMGGVGGNNAFISSGEMEGRW